MRELSSDTSVHRRLLRYTLIWIRASRPFTLSASLIPVFVASALAFAHGVGIPHAALIVTLGAILVQVGTNLVDEYADEIPSKQKNKLIAPYKVIALGLISKNSVRTGALTCFSLATLIGVYLTNLRGWPIFVISGVSLAAAYFYAGGPKPLGDRALGIPLVFIFMGPIIMLGTYYVHSETLSVEVMWLSLPIGCLVSAILVANDLRDLKSDQVSGKKTPVTIFGHFFGRCLWSTLVIGAFGILVALPALGGRNLFILMPLLALPWALKASANIWRNQDPATMMCALKQSASLHFLFGLLLTIGVSLGKFESP